MLLRIPPDEKFAAILNEDFGDNYAENYPGIIFSTPQQFIFLADFANRLANVIERIKIGQATVYWADAFFEIITDLEDERFPEEEGFDVKNGGCCITFSGKDSLAAIADVYKAADECLIPLSTTNPKTGENSSSGSAIRDFFDRLAAVDTNIEEILRFASRCLRDTAENWDLRNKAGTIDENTDDLTVYPLYERNLWIYEQACMKPLKTWTAICKELKEQDFPRNSIDERSVKAAAESFADRHGKPDVPTREPGRPKKKKLKT